MEKDQKTLEQLFAEFVFSQKFCRDTAMVILPPVAVSAISFAGGCAGLAAYGDYACDPLRHQRHELHIEQSTSTGALSLSAADVVMVHQLSGRST